MEASISYQQTKLGFARVKSAPRPHLEILRRCFFSASFRFLLRASISDRLGLGLKENEWRALLLLAKEWIGFISQLGIRGNKKKNWKFQISASKLLLYLLHIQIWQYFLFFVISNSFNDRVANSQKDWQVLNLQSLVLICIEKTNWTETVK